MKKFFKIGCLGFIGLIVLVIVLVIATSGGEETTETENVSKPAATTETTTETATEEPAEEKTGVLNSEKFDQIKSGMTYEEVVKVIGSEGQVMSETGDPGTEFHTVIYEWETDGFMSSANITFQGNKMMNKAQVGVSDTDSPEITLDQFNQISNGLTLEEVIAIVGGEGEVISESGEAGTDLHTVMYSYPGDSLASSVSLMFQGNKLQSKSQFGLE